MAPDDGSPQFDLERVDRPRRGRLPALLISAAAVFVVIALIKPWPALPTDIPDTGNHPARSAQPSPADSASSVVGESGYFQQCYPTANWRLTAIRDYRSLAVRTVWPAAPSFVATDSADAAVRVFGPGVQGIGYCAPGDEIDARAAEAARVSLWRRDASGAIVPVDGARVIDHALAAQGEVYLAPPTPLAANGEWPAGEYFFAISQGSGAASSMTWLALEVMAAPVAATTPAPSASPGASTGPNG
jgi:hypothetical protein